MNRFKLRPSWPFVFSPSCSSPKGILPSEKWLHAPSTLGLKANFASGFYKAFAGSLPFFSLVVVRFIPGAGIEPARDYSHRILSPVCLPVPPSRRIFSDRRRPDSNRRSSFCRAMPYHLATTPIVTLDRLKYEGLVSNGN